MAGFCRVVCVAVLCFALALTGNLATASRAHADGAVGPGVYENTSSELVYVGPWSSSSSAYDSGGSAAKLDAAGSVELSFVGTGVAVSARKNSFSGIADVYLDGVKVATVDLYSASSLSRQVVYQASALSTGTHVIRLERSAARNASSTGGNIIIDSFTVTSAVGPGVYENTSSELVYVGPWSSSSSAYDSGGSAAKLDAAGSVELSFVGTGVAVSARKNSFSGIADVYLDGVKVATVDLYSASSLSRQVVYQASALSTGTHVIRLERSAARNASSTGGNIIIDSFTVTSAVGPGVYENTSSELVYVGPWSSSSSAYDSGGSAAKLDAAGSVELSFVGTGVAVSARKNSFSGIADVYLDGVKVATVDLYSASSLSRQVVYQASALSTGTHVIRLERSAARNASSTGGNIIIDSFTVTSAVGPSQSGRYESDHQRVTVEGGPWQTVSSGYDSGGSYRVSAGSPAAMTFTFYGSGVAWLTRTNNYSGVAKVTIDGIEMGDVDLYSASTERQVPVFQRTDLTHGEHWIRIERSGLKHPSSTGSEISADAFVVSDRVAPAALAAPTVTVGRMGLLVEWAAATEPDVTEYRLYRAIGGGTFDLLISSPFSAPMSLTDIGLSDSTTYSYRVTAVDSSGNESLPSPIGTKVTLPGPNLLENRFDRCPATGTTVSNSADLISALSSAGPGSVIRLTNGTYLGSFVLSAQGTASSPIWICGSRDAILTTGSAANADALTIQNSTHVIASGFTIQNSKKAVMVVSSASVTISDLAITGIGEEAIHLRSGTVDSVVIGNTISSTGVLHPQYGEGVYIGTDPSNWCAFSGCEPDRSDRNSIIDNVFSDTRAEPIEAKAGTTAGLIQGNLFEGLLIDSTFAFSWVSVSGNQYLIRGNHGTHAPIDGYKAVSPPAIAGWGAQNAFADNSGDVGAGSGYGVRVATGVGNLVGCDNTVAAPLGSSNVACQP